MANHPGQVEPIQRIVEALKLRAPGKDFAGWVDNTAGSRLLLNWNLTGSTVVSIKTGSYSNWSTGKMPLNRTVQGGRGRYSAEHLARLALFIALEREIVDYFDGQPSNDKPGEYEWSGIMGSPGVLLTETSSGGMVWLTKWGLAVSEGKSPPRTIPSNLLDEMAESFRTKQDAFHAALDKFGKKWTQLINDLYEAVKGGALPEYLANDQDDLCVTRLKEALCQSEGLSSKLAPVLDCGDDPVLIARCLAGESNVGEVVKTLRYFLRATVGEAGSSGSSSKVGEFCYSLAACVVPYYFGQAGSESGVCIAVGPLSGEAAIARADQRELQIRVEGQGFQGLTSLRLTATNGFNGLANEAIETVKAQRGSATQEDTREWLSAWQSDVERGEKTWERTKDPRHLIQRPPYFVVDDPEGQLGSCQGFLNEVPGSRLVVLGRKNLDREDEQLEADVLSLLRMIKKSGFEFPTSESTST